MGDLDLPNRVALAPMTRGRTVGEKDRVASDAMAEYYAQRASAGLIITEGTVTSLQGEGWWRAPRIFTEKHSTAWRKVTDAVHERDGRIFCQLWHTGRASHSSFRPDAEDPLPVAPSAIPMVGHKHGYTPIGKVAFETPRALTTEEVDAIPEEFKQAAIAAKNAGFDGVELHSANGYLLDEFLQSVTNKRQDKYGGSFENRTRLLLAVVDAVLEVFPANRIGVRISPNGMFNNMGCAEYRPLFLHVAKCLSPFKLAYLHIMNGLGFGFHEKGTPMMLSEFREVYDGCIMANCGYTKEQADKDISAGDCDMVSFGRPFISNPDLVERFAKGIELNGPAKMEHYYSLPGENLGAEGLTDYPTAS